MGHVVDGMATAVENADIIVVCISQNYFDSKNCKKELEYADELGKGSFLPNLFRDCCRVQLYRTVRSGLRFVL